MVPEDDNDFCHDNGDDNDDYDDNDDNLKQ